MGVFPSLCHCTWFRSRLTTWALAGCRVGAFQIFPRAAPRKSPAAAARRSSEAGQLSSQEKQQNRIADMIKVAGSGAGSGADGATLAALAALAGGDRLAHSA